MFRSLQESLMKASTLSKLSSNSKKTTITSTPQIRHNSEGVYYNTEIHRVLPKIKRIITQNPSEFKKFAYLLPAITQILEQPKENNFWLSHLQNQRIKIQQILRQNLSHKQLKKCFLKILKHELTNQSTINLTWMIQGFLQNQSLEPRSIKKHHYYKQNLYIQKIDLNDENIISKRKHTLESSLRNSTRNVPFRQFMQINLTNFIKLIYQTLQLIYEPLFDRLRQRSALVYTVKYDKGQKWEILKYIDQVTLLILQCIMKNKRFKKYHQNLIQQIYVNVLKLSQNQQKLKDLNKKKFKSLLFQYPEQLQRKAIDKQIEYLLEEIDKNKDKNIYQLQQKLSVLKKKKCLRLLLQQCDMCKLSGLFMEIFQSLTLTDTIKKMLSFSIAFHNQIMHINQKLHQNKSVDETIDITRQFMAFFHNTGIGNKFFKNQEIFASKQSQNKSQEEILLKIQLFFECLFLFIKSLHHSREETVQFLLDDDQQVSEENQLTPKQQKQNNFLINTRYNKDLTEKPQVNKSNCQVLQLMLLQLYSQKIHPKYKQKSTQNSGIKSKSRRIKIKGFGAIHGQYESSQKYMKQQNINQILTKQITNSEGQLKDFAKILSMNFIYIMMETKLNK